MNYQEHYDRLIERSMFRWLDVYTEKHHILPRCLGGGNEMTNIVSLLPEEHYVAHLLLAKIHKGNASLIFAAHMMCRVYSGNGSRNKRFKWIREKVAKELSERYTGKDMPEATKIKIGLANKGVKKPPRTESHKLNLKLACQDRLVSEETRLKLSEAGKNRVVSEETRAKIGAANKITAKNHVCSEETKAKMREIISNNANCLNALRKNHLMNIGKPKSEETRNKISQTLQNHPVSDETRAKHRLAWIKRRADKEVIKEAERLKILASIDMSKLIKWCENE